MTDEDFYYYYEIPLKNCRYEEDWEVHSIFPDEASTTQEGKNKALNALYRFIKTNLIEFWSDSSPFEDLDALNKAPLYTHQNSSKYAAAWMGTLVSGTYFFIESEASKLGIPQDFEENVSPDFRSNLEALFQKHDVGFEKGDVYPPK